MTDIPIIFSAPMVRALIDGSKEQTRRLLYTRRKAKNGLVPANASVMPDCWPTGRIELGEYFALSGWQKVKRGDRLWVRESLQRFNREPLPTAQYIATTTGVVAPPGIDRHPNGAALWRWERKAIPSIHMPRWASRLTLVVSGVKIERLQQISEADAEAEGIGAGEVSRVRQYGALWSSLHGGESWRENPWVVAVIFAVFYDNIDTLKKKAA